MIRVALLAGLLCLGRAAAEAPGIDRTVMCGYQGWFNAEGDGAGRGWTHWTTDRKAPSADNIRVDLWPDVSELGPDERFPTGLTGPDGKPAELFSSNRRATVLRHFRWMREHGIDGVYLQRFPANLRDPRARAHLDTVLAHCREGARAEGRALALMYDLSGMRPERFGDIREDWARLDGEGRLTADERYVRHRGKPLVAVWGVGFNDGRAYGLADCRDLVAFFRERGCAVLLGVPCYWRTLHRDAAADPALHELLASVDVISPWTVGRYGTPDGAARHIETETKADLAWCRGRGVDYLPVVFPGFSWHNMKRDAVFNAIPRRKGEFFQRQIDANLEAGATMLYVAMFDEVDEATAIFKAGQSAPAGRPFVTHDGLPADHYLKLTGQAADRLRQPSGRN